MSITLNQDAPAAVTVKTDSSHWYLWSEGHGWSPLHTTDKNYTLREARKDHAAGKVVAPSVTTIMGKLNKQSLIDWKVEQALLTAAKDQWTPGEDLNAWADRIADIASNSSRGAMDLGTKIHANIELALEDKDYDAAMDVYVKPVMAQLAADGLLDGVSEACVGSRYHGYAGRCDLYHQDKMTVADFKSRKSNKNKTPSVPSYSTDAMQTSAYGYAIWGDDYFRHGTAIIYGISTSHPGLLTVHRFTGDELRAAFNAFLGLRDVWIYEAKFNPRVVV